MKCVLKNSVEEPEKQIFTDELQIYSGEGFPEHSAPTKGFFACLVAKVFYF